MEIVAAADGSSLGNPGPAGWAWVTPEGAWRAGGWPKGTNNQGELMAVLDLLQATAGFDASLRILCDSQYVINSVTKWMPGWKRRGWKKSDGKPVQNRDLLEQIDAALAGRQVSFEWVRGHAGHDLNEQADTYARAVATAYQDGREPETGPGFAAVSWVADGASDEGDAGLAAGPLASASDPQASASAPEAVASAPEAAAPRPKPALIDDALFDLDDDTLDFEEAFAVDPAAAAIAELKQLEADSEGRQHPEFEQVGRAASGQPEAIRVALLGADAAIVRSRVDGHERTSVWQLSGGGDAQRWMLRLRQDS